MSDAITDLEEIRVFVAVASQRSFVRAAAALAMPRATVTRKVQSLEARLRARLLQRTSRRVALTEAGERFYERCAAVESALAEAEEAVAQLGAVPRGTLRVSSPHALAQALLTPVLHDFRARYPEIRLWLTIKNEPEELVGKGVDVALSPWPLPDGRHLARKLGSIPTGMFASPRYLRRHGRPRRPEDLAGHATLVYSGVQAARHAWTLHRAGRSVTVELSPVIVANDAGPLTVAARGGAGIALLNHLTTGADVAARALVPVLSGWAGPPIELHALHATRIGMPPKVRVFLDFMVERCRRVGTYLP